MKASRPASKLEISPIKPTAAWTASLTRAVTAAVPAAVRMAAVTGSRLASSRVWRVVVVRCCSVGTAAALTMAVQPAIAVTMVVKEGILMLLKKVADFVVIEVVVLKRRVMMKVKKRTELMRICVYDEESVDIYRSSTLLVCCLSE